MNSGYYAACSGLQTQTQALDLVANNLANLKTNGYRGQQPTFRSILTGVWDVRNAPLNRAINDFNVLGSTRIDRSVGNLEHTGNPLDLGIEGPGFFAVQTKAGILYTRDGNFQVSTRGQLQTREGDPLLGDQGPVVLPTGEVAISADGTISVDGAIAGKLRIVEFAPDVALAPEGTSYYSAPNGSAKVATGSYVRQGMLESSNVNPVNAMVDLIYVQRNAEMLQRAVSAYYNDFNRIAADELPRV